jgi:hypothetical protein
MAKLVDAGADVDQQDEAGKTALNYAVESGDAAQTKALLDLGAEPTQLQGLSPIGEAMTSQNAAIVKLLLQYGADLTDMFPPGDVTDASQILGETYGNADIRQLVNQFIPARNAMLSGMQKLYTEQHLSNNDFPPKLSPGSVSVAELNTAVAAGNFGVNNFSACCQPPLAIILAQGLASPPAVPAAARQHETAGLSLYQKARTRSAVAAAAAEYEQAASAAPWVAAYQEDLCMLYYLAGAYASANVHCTLYEFSSPVDLADLQKLGGEIQRQLTALSNAKTPQ